MAGVSCEKSVVIAELGQKQAVFFNRIRNMTRSLSDIHKLEIREDYPTAINELEAHLEENPSDPETVIRLGFNLWYAVSENDRIGKNLPTENYASRFMALFHTYRERFWKNHHYDAWLEEFHKQRESQKPDLSTKFVFVGPKGYGFPHASETAFRDRFHAFRRELYGDAQQERALDATRQ